MMESLMKSKPMPLCFNKEEFLERDFSVDKFVSDCRKHSSLETMREDLGLYHKILCTSMVELINKDYADFVNLSSNLVGLDKSIKCLTSPLENLKSEVENIKTDLEETLKSSRAMFTEKTNAYKAKVLARHVSSVIEGLEKLETLQNSAFQTDNHEKQIEILERVALTFNFVQFHMSQLTELKDLDHKKAEVLTVSSSIESRLENIFLNSLSSRDKDKILKILRIYSIMVKEHVAEDCFSKSVVRPYMRKLITQGYVSKNGLAQLYRDVTDFITDHCTEILSITSSTNIHSNSVPGYEFLVNSVWPEIMICFDYLDSVTLYSPGDPNLFHKNYMSTIDFLNQFEQFCTEKVRINKLRNSLSYSEFMKKWNLDLYFQVRFQEIAGSFEASLLDPYEKPKQSDSSFMLNITNSLWINFKLCWDENVFLYPLKSQFFGLSMQIISRYKNFVHNFLDKENEKQLEIAMLIKDVDCLMPELNFYFSDHILSLLNVKNLNATLKETFQESLKLLAGIQPKACDTLTSILTNKCTIHLKLISDIPRLYRKTNREMPVNPSPYVSLVFEPLNEFLEQTKSILLSKWVDCCKLEVIQGIVNQCMVIVKDVIVSIKKMEDSLKILKRARDKPSGKETGSGVTDDDKIRRQLAIDVQHLKKCILNLGLKAEDIHDLDELVKLVLVAERSS